MKHCIQCGDELNDDVQFCTKCGANQQMVDMQQSSPQSFSQQVSNTQSSSNDQISKIFSIAVIAFGIVGFVILLVTGADLTTLRSVAGGTVDEAYYQSIGAALIGFAFIDAMFTAYFAQKLLKGFKTN